MKHGRERTAVGEGGTLRLLGLAVMGLLVGLALVVGAIVPGPTGTAHASEEKEPPPPPPCAGIDPPPFCIIPGELVVTKVVVGGPALASDFGFTLTTGGNPITGEQHPGPGSTTTFVVAFNATVTVEETTTQPNYVVDDSDCVNVVVGLGQNTSCTITNTFVPPPASLTILNATTESSAEQFGFTSSLGNFSLANGESQSFGELAAGTYAVTEGTLPAGWVLQGAACDGNDAGTVVQNTLTVTLGPGEDVTCTFTNQAPAAVTPVGDAPVDPGNPAIDVQSAVSGNNAGGTLAQVSRLLRSAQALQVAAGAAVFSTYRVENVGDVPLTSVQVLNDAGTPADPTDDIVVVSGLSLDPGQVLIRTTSDVAVLGSFTSTTTAFGTGGTPPQTVSDSVSVSYEGVTSAGGSGAGGSGAGGDAGAGGADQDVPIGLPNTGTGGLATPASGDAWILVLTLLPITGVAVAWRRRSRRRLR